MSASPAGIRVVLPATSANLGPGFDALGLALSLTLTVEAQAAETFSIAATGRDAALCGQLENNLIVDTYTGVLRAAGRPVLPLRLRLENEIPLGMGCGSSAAALLAGVVLANHFGDLHWSEAAIVTEASRREGHPDNVAACWHGGFTVSAEEAGKVQALRFAGNPEWRLLLAMQPASLATKEARAMLPDAYSRRDAVLNVQRASLLVGAFAQGRQDLLHVATADRLHQPYRMVACPLLERLLPLAGEPGVAAVTLSGAGPSVLVFLQDGAAEDEVRARLWERLPDEAELIPLRIAGGARRESSG